MTGKQALDKVKLLMKKVFSEEDQFEAGKLSDGTVVEYSALEAGANVSFLDADGNQQPAPVGEYEMEDGRILVVVEPGKIAEVREATPPTENPVDQSTEYAAQITALEAENKALIARVAELESKFSAFGEIMKSTMTFMEQVAAEDTDNPAKPPKQTRFQEQAKKKEEAREKTVANFKKFAEAMKKKTA